MIRKWITVPILLVTLSLTYIVIKNYTNFFSFSSLQKYPVSTRNPKPRIFLNISKVPCTCSTSKLKNLLPPEVLNETVEEWSEEFLQNQKRDKTKMGSVILAPPNSPLQYPIHGVVAVPLKKTEIPALELHATERNHYAVTLQVQHGVLAVSNENAEEVEVVGQDQSTLTISSTRLLYLNYVLSTVVYTSTTYQLEMIDLVYFSFEDYMAVFPILVRRPSMPIMYRPGKDINSLVTIVTKTFIRYSQLNILIKSIRNFYPDIKIIIADDSPNPQKVNSSNIEHYFMPPAQGWFAGRNLGVSQVTTKYFLWVDDDFVFNEKTRIEGFVEIMEAMPELDVVGGAVGASQFFFTFDYEEGSEEGGEEGACLTRRRNRRHAPVPGFPNCYYVDGVVNFFLARTKQVQRVGFDPVLKRVAHSEFFIDGLGSLLVATCKGLSVGHQKKHNSGKYLKYRWHSNERSKKLLHFFKNHLKCVKY